MAIENTSGNSQIDQNIEDNYENSATRLVITSLPPERYRRSTLAFVFILCLIILAMNIENSFEKYKSAINSNTYSSSLPYFGEFRLSHLTNNYLKEFVSNNTRYAVNEYFSSSPISSISTDFQSLTNGELPVRGPAKWQFDWSKSDYKSSNAWLSLKIFWQYKDREVYWNLEGSILSDNLTHNLAGTIEYPSQISMELRNNTDCPIYTNIETQDQLISVIFPIKNKNNSGFRGTSYKSKVLSEYSDYRIYSPKCNIEIVVTGKPFPMGSFRFNIVHFSFMYNLKVLLEIRGGIVQIAHTSSLFSGGGSINEVCLSSLILQIILDFFECFFLFYCTLSASSLLVSSFVLMIIFKWMHITLVQARYILWIWRSNYIGNTNNTDITSLISQFSQKLYFSLLSCIILFIGLFKICDSGNYDPTSYTKYNIIKSIPYHIYSFLFFFFIPQIFYDMIQGLNSSSNSNSLPLHPQYVFSCIIGKSFIPIYIWGYKHSIFDTPIIQQYLSNIPISLKNIPSLALQIFVILFTQMAMFFLQHWFGRKCLIPKILRPKPYNYFRVKNIDHLGSEEEQCSECKEEIDLISNSVPNNEDITININNQTSNLLGDIELAECSKQKGIFKKSCVICMTNITVLNNNEDELCAVCTPCDHVFHQKCLKQWMTIKLECPTCRSSIPPFELD
ncbi:zinc finger, C3HC4 type domain-containing protein [Cryptosporidium serpentis]